MNATGNNDPVGQAVLAGDTAVEELTNEESWAVFDKEARNVLGLSGAEFAYRWMSGEYTEDSDPRATRVATLYPRAWQRPAPAHREKLIEVGARALQPAYGAATLKKAALVVDAILARYTVTPRTRKATADE